MSVKMSKSSQNTQSINNIDQDTIERAKMAEERYLKLRGELRIKYSGYK